MHCSDLERLAPHYQIRLFKQTPLDAMAVNVEVLPEVGENADVLAAKAAEVRHHIKSVIGVTCAVTAKLPGEIPRSQGKAVRVVDER